MRGALDTFAVLLKVTAGGQQHAAWRKDPDLGRRHGNLSPEPNTRVLEAPLFVVCLFLKRNIFKANGQGRVV